MAIVNFRGRGAADIAMLKNSKEARKTLPEHLHLQAVKKLSLLNAASKLEQLFAMRGLRIEKLKGKKEGTYSIRINSQYRICFKFVGGNAIDVEIIDYH